jgi:hypothetical protein
MHLFEMIYDDFPKEIIIMFSKSVFLPSFCQLIIHFILFYFLGLLHAFATQLVEICFRNRMTGLLKLPSILNVTLLILL